jgi:beta-N-acetylhexosaminidase
MIGRLLVVGFRGSSLDAAPAIRDALEAGELGGVVLFDRDQLTGGRRNVNSPTQLAALTSALRAAAALPLIISVDEEGGRVARLGPQNGFPATESEAALGARNDLAYTRKRTGEMAQTLASMKIGLNLAPVVDLNLNPKNPAIGALDRSFSADPAVVVANATAEIEAHHAAGVKNAIKHFPGEGSATGNTDFGVVDVTDEWSSRELRPFRSLVDAGVPDAVMVGHIVNRTIDRHYPAALSKATVTGMLRGDLGWSGPVVSDDMQAAAITKAFGTEEAIALALGAGVDVLVLANQQVYDPKIVGHTIDTVVGLVRTGRLSENLLEAAAERVEALAAPLP